MAEGGDVIQRVDMASNEDLEKILDELIMKRMHSYQIEDCFHIFLGLCGDDERSLMINFLKIFLSCIPEAAIRDILIVDDANIVIGYDVDVMQNDLKELNKMFHQDQQKKLKTYLNNFKLFLVEMMHSKTFSKLFKGNRQMLAALNAILRQMCSSEYTRQREVAIVAMFEMLGWMLENEFYEQHDDWPEVTTFEDDCLRMEVDTPSTCLEYIKSRALDCISLPLINDSQYTIRLSVLNYIRENYKEHVDIVKHAGILKGLAFCIMDSSFTVQLSCVKLLLELLEKLNNAELMDWFHDECQISVNCTVVPVNLLIENLTPKASEDLIDTSMKIVIHLEKYSPGRIKATGVNFLFTSLCISHKDAVKLVAELVHAVLCGVAVSSHLADYQHYKTYISYFGKMQHTLSKAIPTDVFVNPWMGIPDSPLLNFEYFVKCLLEEETLVENKGIDLLTVLRAVLCQLNGFFPQKLNRVMLINDMSIDDRRNKLDSFVINFAKFIDGLLSNWNVNKDCLNICLNIVTHIPAVSLTEESLLKSLQAMIEKILLNETFNYKERQRAMRALAHVGSADKPVCKNVVKEVIGNLLESFEGDVWKLADDTEALNRDVLGKVVAGCQNMLSLFDHFDLTPVLEQINRCEMVILLSKLLLADHNSKESKMYVMKIRHSLLVTDMNISIESLTKRRDRHPLHEFDKCVAAYLVDICKIIPILIGWLGNLEDREQVDMLEIVKKELDILCVLRKFDSDWFRNADALKTEDFKRHIVEPLKEWIEARIPVRASPTTEMQPGKIESTIQTILSLLKDGSLLLADFTDFVTFALRKGDPLAIEVVTRHKNLKPVINVLFSLMKASLDEVASPNFSKQRVKITLRVCMAIIKEIILIIMENNYNDGRRVAQATLGKIVNLIFETKSEVLPGSILAHFVYPWFRIIFEYCMPPLILSTDDLLDWEILLQKYPEIAYLINLLCTRTDEDRPSKLQNSAMELIYFPEKYIAEC
ncbi:uncharacterized protein LOC111045514 isoform X2 [Nilaparvata lugens]|uniref:uncharacterized protein LOC111045514 isoform X2 n=1 Tax=Nilaparvata lugens TaxID=108931 RepID=UPI00193D35CC|nr:uncharacterized protein LOC111045514 isoform X2 [Nilaparvata lugens]